MDNANNHLDTPWMFIHVEYFNMSLGRVDQLVRSRLRDHKIIRVGFNDLELVSEIERDVVFLVRFPDWCDDWPPMVADFHYAVDLIRNRDGYNDGPHLRVKTAAANLPHHFATARVSESRLWEWVYRDLDDDEVDDDTEPDYYQAMLDSWFEGDGGVIAETSNSRRHERLTERRNNLLADGRCPHCHPHRGENRYSIDGKLSWEGDRMVFTPSKSKERK